MLTDSKKEQTDKLEYQGMPLFCALQADTSKPRGCSRTEARHAWPSKGESLAQDQWTVSLILPPHWIYSFSYHHKQCFFNLDQMENKLFLPAVSCLPVCTWQDCAGTGEQPAQVNCFLTQHSFSLYCSLPLRDTTSCERWLINFVIIPKQYQNLRYWLNLYQSSYLPAKGHKKTVPVEKQRDTGYCPRRNKPLKPPGSSWAWHPCHAVHSKRGSSHCVWFHWLI